MATINIGDGATEAVDNSNNTIDAGSNNNIVIGNGNNTISLGDFNAVVVGNGSDIIIAGSNNLLVTGNGNDVISIGNFNSVAVGNGVDTVTAGANNSIVIGNGRDNVNVGTSNTIVLGQGVDTIAYNGLTPALTAPASLNVTEESSVALPITLGPPALGHEVLAGFNPAVDVITLDTADFTDFAAVLANATQVDSDTVITLDADDTITLKGITLSSLTSSDFKFVSGTGATEITITGVPTDARLSAGADNGGGNWTLTPTELAGLQLDAGFATLSDLTVMAINPAGLMASTNLTVPLDVQPAPSAVSDVVLPAQPGDPATETRLEVTATVPYADDVLESISFAGLPLGGTLSASGLVGDTIIIDGAPGSSLSTEVDVFSPSATTTNFDLGITASSSATGNPEIVSSSTSQNIAIDYSEFSQNLDFMTSGQSIWDTGAAFEKDFSTGFIGVDGSTKGSAAAHTPIFGATFASAGGSIHFKAGFEADLHITAGDISADLPFNVTLDSTYNKTTDTLQIVPSEAQLGGGSFTEHGPGGSLAFALDLGLAASAHGTLFGVGPSFSTTIGSFTKPVFSKTFNSSTVAKPIQLPAGLTLTLAFPTVNVDGSNPAPGPITNQGTSQDFVNLSGDLVAIASIILFGTDVTDISVGPLKIDLVDLLVGAGLNLVQSFDLSASGLTPILTLADGTAVPFSPTSPTTIPNISSHGVNSDGTVSFMLGLTPDATLQNQTSIGANLTAEIQALGLSIGPIGFTVFDKKGAIQLGTFPPIYSNTFPLAFNSQSISANV